MQLLFHGCMCLMLICCLQHCSPSPCHEQSSPMAAPYIYRACLWLGDSGSMAACAGLGVSPPVAPAALWHLTHGQLHLVSTSRKCRTGLCTGVECIAESDHTSRGSTDQCPANSHGSHGCKACKTAASSLVALFNTTLFNTTSPAVLDVVKPHAVCLCLQVSTNCGGCI